MKRKKEAASLIVVIIVFMFVSTVSMAMISMVASNYKARIVESKRVENLYGSDSGLEVAYNIIGKTFDAATKYGYYEVKELKKEDTNRNDKSPYNEKYIELKKDIRNLEKDIEYWKCYNANKDITQSEINKKISDDNEKIEEDNKAIEDLINKEFKRTFKNFIHPIESEENTDTPPDKLKCSIENKEYVNTVNSKNDFTSVSVQFPNQDNPPTLHIPITEGGNDSVNGIKFENDEYTVIVQSNFETKAQNTNVIGTNQRKVQATYKIKVPDYKDIFFGEETGELEEYLAIKNRGLIIGGDMNVDDTNLEVDGEIFVQGKDPSITSENRTYGKYRGGIKLNNSSKVSFKKDVVTRGTFNIESGVGNKINPAVIEGNLYAANIYAGNSRDDSSINNSYLKINNDAVIDNDLAVKAHDTQIEIENFYGINDKNIKGEINNDNEHVFRSSSSIIVNDYDTKDKDISSVKINQSAYIMGTAHIATDGNYQTGESAAVKGNYVAYSIPLDEAEKFKYDNPLQVLDEDNVFTKVNHFVNYWNNKAFGKANNGGISLPEHTYSIGAILYKNGDTTEITKSKYSLDSQANAEIDKKRKEYAKKVYNLGMKLGNEQELYDSLGHDSINVASIMDLTNISSDVPDYNLVNEKNNRDDKAIFNSDSSKTIVLKGENSAQSYENQEKYIVINTSENKEINAVIATAGNVIIDGDVTFNGTIIANQDLTITGHDVKIKYDPEVAERLQAKNTINVKLFKSVFGNGFVKDYELQNTTDDEGKTADEKMLETKYDLKNFLETKLWKIIK